MQTEKSKAFDELLVKLQNTRTHLRDINNKEVALAQICLASAIDQLIHDQRLYAL